MKKNQLINTCLLLVVLFSSLQTNAQQFAYAAKIDEIKTAGFYKIPISPQVNAKLQLSSFDLRIVNEKNKQIAYIIEQEEAAFKTQHFIDFPILKKEKEKDKQTHITIANATKQSINDLLLITANMQAKRFVNISGSNNLNDWYIIKENIELENYFGNNQATFVQSIGLPTVNYAYFKITILGEDILPVNIIQAGIYTQNYTQGKYAELPIPSFKQIDSSNKNSYIQISFTDAYVIDKLMVEVSGPKFFKRNLNLYAGKTINTSYPYTATINATTTQLSLAGLKSRDILLQINNDDNEPLKIQSIKAFQLQEYILSYLESGHQYKLLFGDSLAEQPVYDLAAFKDSINKNLPILNIGTIESIEYKSTTSPTSSSNKYLLWIALFVVVLILLLFSYKMVQEIKRKNKCMFIYNVTIQVSHSIKDAWVEWMKTKHIPEVMATNCFIKYQFVKVVDIDETEGVTYAAQYYAESKAQYNRYIELFATALRDDANRSWGNQYIGFRSLMEVVD